MSDDGQDLAAAGAGDHEAFARLYDRHGPLVLSLCRRHCLAEAEDATQETFIRAYRMLESLERPDRFRAWLCSIARRVCSERRRSQGRRAAREERAMIEASVQRGPAPGAGEEAEREERMRRLSEAIDELDASERLAIHLYYLQPDPATAAADLLGVSRSGFYKLLARARQSLAARMGAAKVT